MLADYQAKSADWRRLLTINNRKTRIVIGLFLFIYLAIGLLVDLYWLSSVAPDVEIKQLLEALVSLQVPPIATLVMLGIAGLSLLVTFSLHDKLMLLGTDYRKISPQTQLTAKEQQLYNVVEEMKVAAGLAYLPKVYVIDANYMNAFASGYSERSAMIAVTRGLLEKLDRSELQAVVAHELSHIRHMDIKLTLMASVLTNIIVIVLDILFRTVIYTRPREDSRGRDRNQLYLVIVLLRFLLPLITVLLTLYLSRTREYMADAGAVELTRDNQPLANALLKIQQDTEANYTAYQAAYTNTPHEEVRQAAYIFDPRQAGIQVVQSINGLFSTHPSLAKRLEALGFTKNQ